MKSTEEFGMNDSNFIKASDMVLRIMKNIDPEQVRQGNKISSLWTQIVESIRSNSINGENIGKNMASHSRVIDLKNGILLVEADHPGWIQMLGNYKKYILKGFQMKIPELKIETLAFRLARTNAEISKIHREIDEEKQRNAEEFRINKEQKELEKKGFVYKNSGQKKELPSEIQKMFDDIKNDMLTNSN